jgi:DNA (cytosine-5)-methyltransferase 1
MIDLPPGKETLLEGWRFIDLFAGIGGFRFSLEPFGARCVFSSEWDKACQETYEANHGERPSGDITKIREQDVPPHDIVCGGFPCQAYSISGKQLGFDDPRGRLFEEICRIAAFHKPLLLLLENVKNLKSHDEGKTIKAVKARLKEVGYEPFALSLNASDYGVPQARERVFFVAFRKDLGVMGIEAKKPVRQACLRDVLLPDDQTDKYVVDVSKLKLEVDQSPQTRAQEPIRIGKVNLGRQGERIYHPAGHAITLSSGGGGVGAKTGLYLVNGKVRRLSPRECARLMGLPDSFVMNPSETQCYRQFGNGVVVDVIQHIALSLPQEVIDAGKRKVEGQTVLK